MADSSHESNSRCSVESARRVGEVVVSYELPLHRCHVAAVSSSCWDWKVGHRVRDMCNRDKWNRRRTSTRCFKKEGVGQAVESSCCGVPETYSELMLTPLSLPVSPAACPPLPRCVVPPAGLIAPSARGRGRGGRSLVRALPCTRAGAANIMFAI